MVEKTNETKSRGQEAKLIAMEEDIRKKCSELDQREKELDQREKEMVARAGYMEGSSEAMQCMSAIHKAYIMFVATKKPAGTDEGFLEMVTNFRSAMEQMGNRT